MLHFLCAHFKFQIVISATNSVPWFMRLTSTFSIFETYQTAKLFCKLVPHQWVRYHYLKL
jgi:hypothetical protein